MSSNINTGSINVTYPTPGVNNNSQGFRDNFNAISTNLDTAATEITDLQSKAILKSALTGTTLNNDMANAVISNAQTLGFRASTYDLGSNQSGTVNVDLTQGDVQTMQLGGNVTLTFTKWAPTATQSNVEVVFTRANTSTNYSIVLPATVTDGATTLENYVGNGTGGTITFPTGVTRIHHVYSSLNCGTNVEVNVVNRPRNGLATTVPSSASANGIAGQTAYDSSYFYVCVATNTWKRLALTTW